MRRWVIAGAALFFAPSLWLQGTTNLLSLDEVKPADAALVFGAIVRNGVISPLHAERLDAANAVFDLGLVHQIVVSNQKLAARSMRDYLIVKGVPTEAVTLDGRAERTSDTCRAEASRAQKRRVVMISQRFHLPRLALQCSNLGIEGQYLIADSAIRAPESYWTLFKFRSLRTTREAALVWAEILGVYPS